MTFQDRDAMTRMSSVSPVGTLAYVVEEEALLVRVNSGWQYIAVRTRLPVSVVYFTIFRLQLGSLLPITTAPPPTTSTPQLRPPFEASNLINHIPKSADVSSVTHFDSSIKLIIK